MTGMVRQAGRRPVCSHWQLALWSDGGRGLEWDCAGLDVFAGKNLDQRWKPGRCLRSAGLEAGTCGCRSFPEVLLLTRNLSSIVSVLLVQNRSELDSKVTKETIY